MRDYYQLKGGKKGKYALRENTYRRIWYLIADYRYFKCIQAGLADSECLRCGTSEQLRAAGATASYTAAETRGAYNADDAGFDKEQIERYVKAIEDAQKKIPQAYMEGIMEHIINRKKYKEMEGVSERTMKIWVQRFIWNVAHNLGEV